VETLLKIPNVIRELALSLDSKRPQIRNCVLVIFTALALFEDNSFEDKKDKSINYIG
jgi:hypothetical protein